MNEIKELIKITNSDLIQWASFPDYYLSIYCTYVFRFNPLTYLQISDPSRQTYFNIKLDMNDRVKLELSIDNQIYKREEGLLNVNKENKQLYKQFKNLFNKHKI